MAAFPDGIIIRMSSDHFAGIVPLDGAIEHFDQICKDVEDLSLDETLLLNIGVYQLSHNFTTDPSKYLMRSIDLAATAMRHIPQGSKEHIQMFNEDLEKAEKIRTHVLSSVDQAVTEGWHDVYYQPLIDIKSGKLAEFEALSRWIDPIYGFLTPDQFIVPLEDSRLVYKMDLNVLRSFAKDAQVQLSQGQKVYPISFNSSRTDLEASINIYEEIEKIVHDYHLSKDLVHIEITESAFSENIQEVIDLTVSLKNKGFLIEIDDFGSGYSSLSALTELLISNCPPDFLSEKPIVRDFINILIIPGTFLYLHSFALIELYNGKRGFVGKGILKYSFYIIYPLHLFVLYLLRYIVFKNLSKKRRHTTGVL